MGPEKVCLEFCNVLRRDDCSVQRYDFIYDLLWSSMTRRNDANTLDDHVELCISTYRKQSIVAASIQGITARKDRGKHKPRTSQTHARASQCTLALGSTQTSIIRAEPSSSVMYVPPEDSINSEPSLSYIYIILVLYHMADAFGGIPDSTLYRSTRTYLIPDLRGASNAATRCRAAARQRARCQ